jgi:hypothetical protein
MAFLEEANQSLGSIWTITWNPFLSSWRGSVFFLMGIESKDVLSLPEGFSQHHHQATYRLLNL